MATSISQLIAYLQEAQAEHGDLPVYRPTNGGWRISPVTLQYTEVRKVAPPEYPDAPAEDDSDGNELPPLFLVVS